MLLLIHTLSGFAGLVAGVLSARSVHRRAASLPGGARLRTLRLAAWFFGAILGAAYFAFAEDVGYGIETPQGMGTVVGLPFLVAFFDAEGNDYVGWITYPGVLGNAVFWLLAPQILLALYAFIARRAVTPDTSLERSRKR